MLKYCMTCGVGNDYKNQSCSSCKESFNKIEPPKSSSAGIIRTDSQNKSNQFNINNITEEDAVLEFDFSSIAKDLEEHLKNNSEKALCKTISLDDLLRGK